MRDRSNDRVSFPDPAFNEWLDTPIEGRGITTWHIVPDLKSAWVAWCAAQRRFSRPTPDEVVVTKNDFGHIVAVSRQDDKGQITSMIAESAPRTVRVRAIGVRDDLEIDRIEGDGSTEVVYVVPPVNDRAQREVEFLRAQLTAERARANRLIDILTRIHSLCQPPAVTAPDGTVYWFAPPPEMLVATWRELSKRIRAIPDELAKAPTHDSWGQSAAYYESARSAAASADMRERLAQMMESQHTWLTNVAASRLIRGFEG